jgi:hypothetical protein
LTGWRHLDGEMKKARHRFGSATHARRRAADGCARCRGVDRGGGSSGETEEEENPSGPVWAESTERSGPVVRFSKETTRAIKVNRAELTIGCGKFFSQFSNKDLGFKIKDFKFQTKIELG